MTTRLDHVLTYDAPLADVAAMLADPAFREEVCRRTHTIRHAVSIEGSGAGMHVTLDQAQSASGIPSFAKKLVGEEIHYIQVEEWSTVDHARVTVTIPGKPGEMKGTIDLAETAGTTREAVSMDIKVGIPFVGGKIEALVADMLRAALEIENTVGQDYLSR